VGEVFSSQGSQTAKDHRDFKRGREADRDKSRLDPTTKISSQTTDAALAAAASFLGFEALND